MATNIPPHNLGEVVNGVHRADRQSGDRTAGSDGDHPRSGFPDRRHDPRPLRHLQRLCDRPRLDHHARQASTSRRSRGDREAIIITEIPYQVNKATMIEKMAELVRDKRIEGISDIRDESDRQGYRVVIELKRDADRRRHPQPALPLHAAADLVRRQHGGAERRQAGSQLTLIDMLQAFVAFREEVDQPPHEIPAAQGARSRPCPGRPRDRRRQYRRGHHADPPARRIRRRRASS